VLATTPLIGAAAQLALERRGDKRARRDCLRLLTLIAYSGTRLAFVSIRG
jgi:hypothetical protein